MKFHDNQSKGTGDMEWTRKCYGMTDRQRVFLKRPFRFAAGDLK